MNMCVYIHTYIHMCTHRFIHIHVYIYICICIYIYIYTHIYIYIHTYIERERMPGSPPPGYAPGWPSAPPAGDGEC